MAPPPPQQQQQQAGMQGFVIITLPPPDDPSKGKTVTAFTLSVSEAPERHHPPPQPQQHIHRQPRRRPRLFQFTARNIIAVVLPLAFIGAVAWASLSSEMPFQLLGAVTSGDSDSQRRNETRSFLLPLYAKERGRVLREVGDVKLRVLDGFEGVRKDVAAAAVKGKGKGSSDAAVVIPMRGNIFPDGQYYTSISVGIPPKPYYLDVDTGSDLTWIQCDAPCASCAKGPHPLYKPARGKIVPRNDMLCQDLQGTQQYSDALHQCDYQIDYADQSSSMGVLARDEMFLSTSNGDKEKVSYVFGCAYNQQGQLLSSPAKTDGILGLSSARISMPSQLAHLGLSSNVIGHCMTREASGGGYLFFGDDYVPRWGMTWVPTQNDQTNLYTADVENINYGSQLLNSHGHKGNSVQVIVDTGSSYTYFPEEAYLNLIASINDIHSTFLVEDGTDQTLPLCWKTESPVGSIDDVRHLFKPLTLHFRKRWGVIPTKFTIPPEGYLVISGKGNVCLGILNGMEIDHGSDVIIGDVSLRGKLLVYDNEQSQMGWMDSECANPEPNKGFPFFF